MYTPGTSFRCLIRRVFVESAPNLTPEKYRSGRKQSTIHLVTTSHRASRVSFSEARLDLALRHRLSYFCTKLGVVVADVLISVEYVGNARFWYKHQRKNGDNTREDRKEDLNPSRVSAQTVLSSRLF